MLRLPPPDRGVTTWFEVAEGRRSFPRAFQRFIALWEALNRYYRFCYPCSTDADALRRFANDEAILSLWDGVQRAPSFHERLRRLTEFAPLGEMRGPILATDRPLELTVDSDFYSVLNFIYRIRCNLYHGGKRADNARDAEAANAAAEMLEPLLRKLVSS